MKITEAKEKKLWSTIDKAVKELADVRFFTKASRNKVAIVKRLQAVLSAKELGLKSSRFDNVVTPAPTPAAKPKAKAKPKAAPKKTADGAVAITEKTKKTTKK